jgi:capsular exopolysaccharide synthesis family protein
MDALVVTSHSRSVIAEQFRIIRSNLQYIIANIQNPVILITSSFSGEGKSFIATNIGAVMALAGKRTIILEFDIRKPKIMSHLQMPKKPGLTNYLLGKISLSDLAVPVPEQENLFVLPCGPVPPNPSELLLDFDIIIMDTAPVGMVSDALTLSKFSNATFFIIRQGYTFKKQLQQINEYYHQGKLPKLSLILNDVKVNRGYGYYGYGNYGYGSGYFDDEESQKETVINTWLGWMGLNGKAKKKKHKKHNI